MAKQPNGEKPKGGAGKGCAPRRGGGDKPPRYTTEQIITALRKAGGIQARAAKLLKCDRSTICKRIAGEPALQLVLAEITETQLDDAEDVLNTRMRDDKNANSQLQAVTFYLKTKGRARGYGTSDARPISLELGPIETVEQVVDANRRVIEAVAGGQVTPGEGKQLADLLTQRIAGLVELDTEARLRRIEEQLEREGRPLPH